MSFISDLQDRKIAIGVELKAMDATKAGGAINESGGGATFDHVGYKDGLYREIENINKLLASAGGVAEVTSEAIG